MSKAAQSRYEFGPFRLDAAERLLVCNGEPLPLTAKAFDTLLALVENRGHIVDKNTLMKRVWPDTAASEATLAQNVFTLRKLLGEGDPGGQYIETVPKHGYRFVAGVREIPVEDAGLIVEKHAGSRITVEEQETLTASGRSGRETKLRPGVLLAACVGAVTLAGIAAYFLLASEPRKADEAVAARTLAVLPFKPLGQENGEEYLGLGMADSLITKLGNVGQLIVRPTSAVRKYTEVEQDPLVAGREQQVDLVLEGSIQRSGEKTRVTVRLISIQDGASLWAFKCDEQCTDIFTLQDAVSEKVAQALTLKLTGEERGRLTRRYTDNLKAYNFYLQGRYFWNRRTEEGAHESIRYFEQALQEDPNYALAYVGLADSYNILGFYSGLPPKEAFPKAKAAAERALALDDSLAEAHASLAYVRHYHEWDWAGAEEEFKRALERKPNYSVAHQWYANYLVAMGRFDEAIAQMKRAEELDPTSLIIKAALGWAYYYARQYDQSIAEAQKTLEMDRSFLQAHRWLAWAYEQKAMRAEATKELEKAVELSARGTDYLSELGHAYALSGRRAEAQKIISELKGVAKRRYVSPYNMALIYAGLGEKEQAFAWLEKAHEDRSRAMALLKVDPRLDSLHPDPRFADLLRRVGTHN